MTTMTTTTNGSRGSGPAANLLRAGALILTLGGCASTTTSESAAGGDAPGGPPEFPAYGSLGTFQFFDDMGTYGRTVTTDSAEAQRAFDQGLAWLFAFNHDEAVLSFEHAAKLDPRCAMAWWGVSYAQGPNYNDPYMSGPRNLEAWAALQRAKRELDGETDAERGLVEALEARYVAPEDAPMMRGDLDAAFAEAMGELAAEFPGDADIASFHAESMMVRYPWMLYDFDGDPARDDTRVIVEVLEAAMERSPDHPGLCHLYIHAIEPSNEEAKAVAAADRLCDLVPDAGHMLHMPSHIYVQVGMWDEAIEQNRRAMAADDVYRSKSPDQMIQHFYMAHNSHMRAFAAMMVGDENAAMESARAMWEDYPPDALALHAPMIDGMMGATYDVMKRFGRWDDLIAEPAPPEAMPITTAVWRAHRAVAFAALGQMEDAAAEQQAFREGMREVPVGPMIPWGDVMTFLMVSEHFVTGELALQSGHFDEAVTRLEHAAAFEDRIGYGEPPRWLQPVRHTLGVAQLKAGRPEDAAATYREDLEKWPRNGWSLLGLSQALEAMGDEAGAAAARAEFEDVWRGDLAETTSSCRCVTDV